MTSDAKTPDEYISQLPEERKEPMSALRGVIRSHLPKGFEETMSYGMIGYVVPHSMYPDGYHCSPELPLPFMNIASQKNFIALYHMGVYANKELLNWFTGEYPKYSSRKLDMGKSCIRFKKMDDIPLKLIGELCAKMSVQDWIDLYEKNIKKTS
ncbi:DUF1801 domain-containing protein [Muriicola sp.]|uniref:DUF1801 domain-containing protein n=1 Tax=Muriicola sp. TaxID=2020856 RepID=UPI003562D3FA